MALKVPRLVEMGNLIDMVDVVDYIIVIQRRRLEGPRRPGRLAGAAGGGSSGAPPGGPGT